MLARNEIGVKRGDAELLTCAYRELWTCCAG
jgi:hypothetical protein